MTDSFKIDPSKMVKVALVSDIKPGCMKCVEIKGRRILVANVDGEFYATDELCTHEDASLSLGMLKDGKVKCPLHGSWFDIKTGEVMDEPAEENLCTYKIKVEGTALLINPDQVS